MTNLPRIIHLVTTDAEFRAALQVDPRAALAGRGLEAISEELVALIELGSLIVVPSQKLSDLLEAVPLQTWRSVTLIPASAV